MKNNIMKKYILNSHQADVVLDESKELIVPAGAGSGKTKTLVTKVVHLLEQGKDLESFLVLTFTKKAASEMKSRIKKALKDTPLFNKIDSSDIATFDSFAYNFVKQNANLINLDSNIELLDQEIFNLKKDEFLNQIIINIMQDENSYYYDFVVDYTNKRDDADLINDLKNLYEKLINLKPIQNFNVHELVHEIEMFDVEEDLNAIINVSEEFYEENSETILYFITNAKIVKEPKTNNPYTKSRFKWTMLDTKEKKDIEKILKPYRELEKYGIVNEDVIRVNELLKQDAEKILNILLVYEKMLVKFKQDYNKYEFRDIANFLNQILRENVEALKRAKEKYKYVFVDEYQDTSLVQSEFLEMLIEDNDDIKVLYVGDIKQSIYKFRDAKPETFIEKSNTVNNIPLSINYRSSPNVIDFVNKIFLRILDDKEAYDIDYSENHHMESGTIKYKETDPDADVFLLEYYQDEEKERHLDVVEEAFITGYKIKELIKEGKVKEFKEVAILTRNTTSFKIFKDVFRYLDVPLEIHVDFPLKETYLLKLIANILRLSLNLFNSKSFNDNRFYYLSLLRSELYSYSDYKIFTSLIDTSTIEKNKKLNIDKEIKMKLIKINQAIHTLSNTQVVKMVLEEFDVYEKIIYAPKSFEKELQLDYLYEFSQTLSDLDVTAGEFVDYIYDLAYNDDIKIKIPILQDDSKNNVVLTNIHQAKGLEYNTLFMCELKKPFNKGRIKKFKYTNAAGLLINKPFDDDRKFIIRRNIISGQNKEFLESLKEELRLLYVSMTRAIKALYIVSLYTETSEKLDSFNDYLYFNNFTEFIKEENITVYNDHFKDFDYFKKLKDPNLYYSDEVESLEPHLFEFKARPFKLTRSSLTINKIITSHEQEALKMGIKLHEEFEHGNKIEEVLFKHSFDGKSLAGATIYKEHQFNYTKNNNNYSGIIDLLAVYDDEIHIIDFKTRDISPSKYEAQLNSYKDYVKQIFITKPVKLFMYSIVEDKINKL